MKRIDLDGIRITKRMITNTKKDRSVIYREAAKILETYLDSLSNKEIIKKVGRSSSTRYILIK